MGFLDKLINVFEKANKPFIPVSNIEDCQPDLKIPDYDKLFSLKIFLEKSHQNVEQINFDVINKIMNSSSPFEEAKSFVNDIDKNTSIYELGTVSIKKLKCWIIVLSLWDVNPERVIDSCFEYILCTLADKLMWSVIEQKAFSPNGLDLFYQYCRSNNYEMIAKYIDNEVLSCLALAHIRSKLKLTQVVSEGVNYIETNCKNLGSFQGSFYNIYGKEKVIASIEKIIESAYRVNIFSLKSLFLRPVKNNDTSQKPEAPTLKYDVSKMKKDKTVYLPNKADEEQIISDILSLNPFIEQAKTLTKKFPNVSINKNDIIFCYGKDKPNIKNFCRFSYSPYTKTGKQSKYPICLHFYCKGLNGEKYIRTGKSLQYIAEDCIFGDIEYKQDNQIGKIKIVIWSNGNSYVINVIDKKGSIMLTKIETSNRKGEKIVLYNVNSK